MQNDRSTCCRKGAAISIFGLQSGAALATVVGVLVEVPVTLERHPLQLQRQVAQPPLFQPA